MNWKKLGLIFDLKKNKVDWLKSHAMMPLPLVLDDRIRVYYTGRHNDGKSRISFIDIDKKNLSNILYIHNEPLLEVGKVGTFDDCGTVGTMVMKIQDKIYLYYNGYNVRNTVPWSNSIGLAVSSDNGVTFKKMYEGPIMDRNKIDPYFTISPSILVIDGVWHMWYTSGTGWLNIDERKEPIYNIKYASSKDGINWDRDNSISIEQDDIEECVARATVIQEADKLLMWFIYRGSRDFRDGTDSYRIGYAEASINDPKKWFRMDNEAGIKPGPETFDNKMQAYAAVIKIDNRRLMFYNGNGFGEQGICAAFEDLKNI